MIQLVVEGIFLDLYENDLPKITLQFDSFETFQPQSAYSQNFRVPATDNNYKFFKTAYEVNGYDFDITIRKEAQILVDGAEFVSGELRLNKIFKSVNNKIDYEVLFLGKTRDFASKLGNKKLNELDLSELTHLQSMTFVRQSWLAYPSIRDYQNNTITSTLTSGFLNGNILYPLVDFGNTYDEDELVEQVAISVGNNQHITQGNTSVVPVADRIWADRFKPMVRARYLFDKVFEEAGFTYTSNFLTAETNPFQRLYVSAWGNEDSIYTPTLSSDTRVNITFPFLFSLTTPPINIPFDEVQYDYNNGWDETTNTYTSPKPGTNNVSIVVQVLGIKPIDETVSISLRNNGFLIENPITGNPISINTPAGVEEFEFYYNGVISVSDTDEITVQINSSFSTQVQIQSGFFKAVLEDEINISSLLEDKYKQIDFVRDILTTFKLVMVPDRINPGNFLIETWNNFIGKGDVYDWTDKLDLSKDLTIEPLFFNQKAEVNFTTADEKDWLNDLNQTYFKENFGDLEVDANNDLLKDTKEIKVNYAATPITEIQGASTNVGGPTEILVGRDNMVIPHIYSLEAGETRALRKPIKPKTRFLFYNGMKYTGRVFDDEPLTTTNTTASWYWRDDSGTTGYSSILFPQVSPYQYTFNPNGVGYNPDVLSLNLTWQVENGYLRYGTLSGGYSVYDLYWSDYISLIYNKYSRRFTANFILSAEDLYNFNFNDVIFIKDTYYYVEKIINVPIGEKSSVKVSLIKLIDYKPDQGGFIPPGDFNIWGTTTEIWGTTTDTWND